ncbi:hypothetical protein UUU_07080 [Klebsiella pneumoniae subsp. pneumoniae DSM 30104 = JCM 1662 = NBRC 14940]|nr:hypothetical protein UUU_07080 [Klebsiella pneumoniae subsp. pneumoniae DSM 30104 = JCM 1662 = NBRC 14940]
MLLISKTNSACSVNNGSLHVYPSQYKRVFFCQDNPKKGDKQVRNHY